MTQTPPHRARPSRVPPARNTLRTVPLPNEGVHYLEFSPFCCARVRASADWCPTTCQHPRNFPPAPSRRTRARASKPPAERVPRCRCRGVRVAAPKDHVRKRVARRAACGVVDGGREKSRETVGNEGRRHARVRAPGQEVRRGECGWPRGWLALCVTLRLGGRDVMYVLCVCMFWAGHSDTQLCLRGPRRRLLEAQAPERVFTSSMYVPAGFMRKATTVCVRTHQ